MASGCQGAEGVGSRPRSSTQGRDAGHRSSLWLVALPGEGTKEPGSGLDSAREAGGGAPRSRTRLERRPGERGMGTVVLWAPWPSHGAFFLQMMMQYLYYGRRNPWTSHW